MKVNELFESQDELYGLTKAQATKKLKDMGYARAKIPGGESADEAHYRDIHGGGSIHLNFAGGKVSRVRKGGR